ncbi:MAG: DUF4175 family protein [Bradymonadaceae bacterium]|nr:DUF4175 family protein [Lujinxingiaceae bacterium]
MTDSSTDEKSAGGAQSQWRALQVYLRKTEVAVRGPVILEGAIWYLVTALAVVLAVLLFTAALPSLMVGVGGWLLVIGLASATLLASIALALFLRRKHDVYTIAARLQRHHPEFRNDLVAALEFGEVLFGDKASQGADLGFSTVLAEAHIARTVRKLTDLQIDGHLAHLIPRRDLTTPAMSLAGGAVLVLIPLAFFPTWTLNALLGSGSTTAQFFRGSSEVQPVVGALEVVLSYPAYTGLERQHIRGSTGHIETMIGTEVIIRTRKRAQGAVRVELVFVAGEETQVIAMQEGADEALQLSLMAMKDGVYHFRAVQADGTLIQDGIERHLRVVPDEAPGVSIAQPAGRELEVRADDVIEFNFSVSDDFGIASVERVFHFAGGEQDLKRQAIDLPQLTNFPRNVDGSFVLDLGPLGLQPKDTLVVYIEAKDNNKITGPGIGQSEPITLYVASPEDKHLQNIADQQELAEALLLHLADFLESPVGDRVAQKNNTYKQVVSPALELSERRERFGRVQAAHGARPELLGQMEALTARLREDPLMLTRDVTFFAALVEQLKGLQKGGDTVFAQLAPRAHDALTILQMQQVADYAARSEDVLEKGVLRLEELLASQKMEAIKATADDIRQLKERLKELLEQYKETQDPELKEAIKREVQRLRQRMSELMARMQMQLQKLPQEHVNMEALEAAQLESDTKQLADQLQSIEQMLEDDDIDGALKALEEMDATLDSLTQDMDKAFSESQPEGISELDKQMAELLDKVNDLETLEKSIEKDTRALQEEMAERRKESTERMLKPFTENILKQIEQQERSLDRLEARELPSRDRPLVEESRKKLQGLREMIEQQDIEQGLDRARSSLDSLRALRQMMSLSQRYSSPQTKEHREVGDALRDLNPTIPQGQQIVDELEQMMAQSQPKPQPGERQRLEELAERQQRASEQADQLGEGLDAASQRFPTLEQQLRPRLDGAKQSMGKAQQSLEESNTQRALDEEREALDQLGQLKQEMRNALQRQRNEQRQSGQDRNERVEIPTQDSRKTHEQYRKEIMDGMREGRLEDYQTEIERYYKSLVE